MAAIAVHLCERRRPAADQHPVDRNVLAAYIARIDVTKNQLAIKLKRPVADDGSDVDQEFAPDMESDGNTSDPILRIPWCKPPSRKSRELLLPPSIPRRTVRPMKAERRTALLMAIARGRTWLDEIISGTAAGPEQLAALHKCSVRHVTMTISMAFIAPPLVKAAIEGRLPRGIGVANLRDAPAEWSRQFERLGLSQPD
jgi:site-specific DNA recombinase